MNNTTVTVQEVKLTSRHDHWPLHSS